MPMTTTSTASATSRASSFRALPVLALAALLVPASGALAVSLTMERTAIDGGARLCIGVDSAGQNVAGTQNDLVWNGTCATLQRESCAAVADSNKPLHGNMPQGEDARYRALVFALDNVDPVRDGQLYCCDFTLSGSSDGCCAVRFDRLGVSDPSGNSLPVTAQPAELCLASGAAPVGAAAGPTPAPAAPVPAEGNRWVWVVLIAVVVIIVAVLALRGRAQ